MSPYLHEWVFSHAAGNPDAPAIATRAVRLTYGDLAVRVRALAARIQESGERPHDHVLIALPNVPATVVASLANQMLGATAVEVNRDLGEAVLGAILAGLDIRFLFVAGRDIGKWSAVVRARQIERIWVVQRDRANAVLPDTIVGARSARLGDDGRVGREPTTASVQPYPNLDPSSPAVILYTSGSTGQPHGVIQTHGNIAANTRSIVEYLALTHDDRALLTLPLHYCYGRSVLQTHLFVGGSLP